MKLVKAEEIEFFYIFPEDDLVKEETTLINSLVIPDSQNRINQRLGGFTSEQLIETLQNGTDTRLAIFGIHKRPTLPLKDNYDAYQTHCLFWTNKDINLKELDQKIKDESYTDEDFHSAVIAHVQYAYCRHCRNRYLALVCDKEIYMFMYIPVAVAKHVPFGDYYDKKLDMIEIGRCPNCNELIGFYVVRFFDKVEDGN